MRLSLFLLLFPFIIQASGFQDRLSADKLNLFFERLKLPEELSHADNMIRSELSMTFMGMGNILVTIMQDFKDAKGDQGILIRGEIKKTKERFYSYNFTFHEFPTLKVIDRVASKNDVSGFDNTIVEIQSKFYDVSFGYPAGKKALADGRITKRKYREMAFKMKHQDQLSRGTLLVSAESGQVKSKKSKKAKGEKIEKHEEKVASKGSTALIAPQMIEEEEERFDGFFSSNMAEFSDWVHRLTWSSFSFYGELGLLFGGVDSTTMPGAGPIGAMGLEVGMSYLPAKFSFGFGANSKTFYQSDVKTYQRVSTYLALKKSLGSMNSGNITFGLLGDLGVIKLSLPASVPKEVTSTYVALGAYTAIYRTGRISLKYERATGPFPAPYGTNGPLSGFSLLVSIGWPLM